ncbi:hypothetical protein BSR29_07600 [Boudabousia liubingyangii]|uniref:S9 family peptidase n=1 Tax=Boudabousia liubingyangii TaxID=1921764 RepID=A0A1Q5PKC0_9ACTO|nr:S9 family peptidase [Boudabousia liubingyangii]OKL46670.1 hypothetical protein BSR29_07600 [Boudabousia liubingyangii]
MNNAPIAPKHPTERTHHGHTHTDNYEWLREKTNPEVIKHLEAENAWTDTRLDHTKNLQNTLVKEYEAHTALDDVSVPIRLRNYWYYSAIQNGQNYRNYYRLPADPQNPQEQPPHIDPQNPRQDQTGNQAHLLIDQNRDAEGHQFYQIANLEISPNDQYLTYGVDNAGDERFTQKIINLASGQTIDEIQDVVYGTAFTADSSHLYYVRADETWRPYQVWVHEIGKPADTDQLVYEEKDETYWMSIGASRDGNWIIIHTGATNTSEIQLIDSHALPGSAAAKPTSVAGRHQGLEYQVEPAADHLLIIHNLNCVDSELAWAPLPTPGVTGSPNSFQTLATPQEGERYLGINVYATHAVLELRSEGMASAHYYLTDPNHKWVKEGELTQGNPVETVSVTNSDWFYESNIRWTVESLATPPTTLDTDPITGENTVLKVANTPGYKAENYIEERHWATADDGTQIPYTTIRHKDTPVDGTAPALIYGYGSYEVSVDPMWSPMRQSLLDRGMVWALASPRGGGEMGRRWYENGRTNTKKNTFSDFVACSKDLIAKGYSAPDRLAAQGGSAGGLLMGAIANLAPETYRVILAQVPFVDALTTILMPELPLTAGEWEEWGNPITDPAIYEYMRSYTPCENIRPGTQYPAILATTSLNDTRVYYVEPAKWVQLLREETTNDPVERPILLHCEMVAGHAGTTGRAAKWKEVAYDMSFVLDQLGIAE